MNLKDIVSLGQLKESKYISKDIRTEMRDNLLKLILKKTNPFKGIYGYDQTVIPELQRAILSRHHINLLGLRGQAKTRIARQLTDLLDEYIPVIAGSELNEDPLQPLTESSRKLIQEQGDDTPISWVHRSERFAEKLATPDVSVADLIGDVDPIKAANLRLSYADERVIHYGLIPRSNRCIFVINELPDLQARIQVALFNILQEGDIQIRGFRWRIPLDLMFVFTANPEDYTNRGSIVTPLKDRIGSQILTHYPTDLHTGMQITLQEARITSAQQKNIHLPALLREIIEQTAIEARNNEFVDSKSGVSARLTISALENLMSAAELRMLQSGLKKTTVRIADLQGIIPSINGKIELVYEGEQEGAATVSGNLISKAIRNLFISYFPDPATLRKKKEQSPYHHITSWFSNGRFLELQPDDTDDIYIQKLEQVSGLKSLISEYISVPEKELYIWMEFVLHALAEHSQIGRQESAGTRKFTDLFGSLMQGGWTEAEQ